MFCHRNEDFLLQGQKLKKVRNFSEVQVTLPYPEKKDHEYVTLAQMKWKSCIS